MKVAIHYPFLSNFLLSFFQSNSVFIIITNRTPPPFMKVANPLSPLFVDILLVVIFPVYSVFIVGSSIISTKMNVSTISEQ